MTYPRTCDYCGEGFEAKRSHARWCSGPCSQQGWIEEQVYGPLATAQSVERGVGSRGGNVRSVQEARDLQGEQKDKRDWGGAIDERIRLTLLETGHFHADDLDALEVPPEHCNLKGTRAAWFRNKRYMGSTGVYRKVSHAAANGRKAPIYRITKLGREKLVGLSSTNAEGSAANIAFPSGTLDRPDPNPRGSSSGAASSSAAESGQDRSAGLGADERSKSEDGLDSAELPVSPSPISVDPGTQEPRVGREAGAGVPDSEPVALFDEGVGKGKRPSWADPDQEWAA